MATDERPRKAFEFFQAYARSGQKFALDEFLKATGYEKASFDTYRSKQWRELLVPASHGFHVRREFLRLTEREFLDHITQKRPLFARYQRRAHPCVLSFEFLLPLTRESQLRAALDHLFFLDTLRQRVLEIGLRPFERLLPREAGEADDAYLDRAVQYSNKFFGYSISHVDGRFRASSELETRVDAAAFVSAGGRYLIDETTAIVRFVLPLQVGQREFADSLSMPEELDDLYEVDEAALLDEARALRTLFFLLFAEAIVRTVKGEDEIWLLERGVTRDRLYAWSRVAS